MKRLLISVFAVAAALFATSCAQDGLDNSAAKGEEAVVTFAVNAPEMATRALFGDGTAANQLYYAVYDEDNKVIDAISVIDNPEAINISTQVKLRLVNGNTYSLIFWAQNADGVVDIDWDAQTMTYDPTTMSVEAYDAFWAYVEPFKVNGAMQKNVDLYRPFAQVIIGAADYDDAVAAGLTVAETQITVNTPSAMSLVDGAASTPAEFTYAYAALPTEAFPIADHQHMGMTYLLFGADKGMVDIKFDYKDAANNEYSRNFPAVPVQRNFRTIIYGNLLTSQTDFNVKIVPQMEDIEHPMDDIDLISSADELKAALADPAVTEITLAPGVYEGLFEFDANREVTIVGANGVSRSAASMPVIKGEFGVAGSGIVNFSGIAFETPESFDAAKFNNQYLEKAAGSKYIISIYVGNVNLNNCEFNVTQASTGAIYQYAANNTRLVVKNSTFKTNGNYAIRARAAVTVENCVFDGMVRQCLQVNGNPGFDQNTVFVSNKVTNYAPQSVLGVSLANNYEAKNIDFNVGANDAAINNISYDPAKSSNILPNIDTYTFSGEVKEIVDETTLSNPVESSESLVMALKYAEDGDVLVLGKDVALPAEAVQVNADVTIDLNGMKLDASANESRPFEIADGASLVIEAEGSEIECGKYGLATITEGTLTINGGTFTNEQGNNGSFIKVEGNEEIVINLNDVNYTAGTSDSGVLRTIGENVTVNVDGGSYEAGMGFIISNGSVKNAEIFATNTANMWPAVYAAGPDVLVEGCEIKANCNAVAVAGGETLTVNNCNVVVPDGKLAFQIFSSGGTINVNNCTWTGGYGTTGKINAGCPDAVINIDGVEKYRKSAK